MIFKKMKRNCFLRLFSIVLAIHTIQDGLWVNVAASASHKARSKIDLSDPFYNGQIQYDDTLTETPIGTIVYAIDDESVDVDPFDKAAKTIQLQDVVTHGIPNDKSFINHNLFTIGDGNDAIVERDSDEDEDDDDGVGGGGGGGVVGGNVFDIDGVVDKQHSPVHSKFANFAFNNEKVISKPKIDNNKKLSSNNPEQIELQQKQQHQQQHQEQQQQQQQQSNLSDDQNTEHVSHQGQVKATNTFVAPHSTNRQMNYKHSNRTSIARMKSHRHHNRKPHHSSKWYRRHQKWLKSHKAKVHRNHRHHSLLRSGGSKSQYINSDRKTNGGSGSGGGGSGVVRSSPSYVQAHVSFYDPSFDDTLNSNRFTSAANYRNGEKWPHLKKLQSQLHQDILSDSLPPYIKKYSRRNKQLIGLLEGEGMPNAAADSTTVKQQVHSRRRQKQTSKWIEKNLFEEQLDEDKQNKSTQSSLRSGGGGGGGGGTASDRHLADTKSIESIILNSKQRYLTEKNVQSEPNALPGEHLSLSSEEYDDCDDGVSDCSQSSSGRSSSSNGGIGGGVERPKTERITKKQAGISPKADSFLFHRVATPKLVGTASIAGGGGLIKQRLPFVALTDKRIEDGTRQRRINNIQNTFPLP